MFLSELIKELAELQLSYGDTRVYVLEVNGDGEPRTPTIEKRYQEPTGVLVDGYCPDERSDDSVVVVTL